LWFKKEIMSIEQQQYDLEVITGACSISPENRHEVDEIASIRVKNIKGEMIRPIYGVRDVGLKSRTELGGEDDMGMDYPTLKPQIEKGRAILELTPPSVEMASQIVAETDLLIATEIMMPDIQIPHFVGKVPQDKLLLWSPAVDQLGWHMLQMVQYAQKHQWHIGIKNGKTLGSRLDYANDPARQDSIELERTWAGLASYAKDLKGDQLVLIHRGVEDPDKGDFRSALVDEVARRVKHKVGRGRLFFDPSHSFGPKLRDNIIEGTIKAMLMRDGNGFLYDGILIEAGHSKTDTKQHITLDELRCLVEELSKFRNLRQPTTSRLGTSVTIYPSVNSESAVI
jgi:hypothetical protein